MYDPTIARFLQEDTYTGDKNDPLSLNLYAYCNNNPLIYNDPTGHWPKFLDDAVEAVSDIVEDVKNEVSEAWEEVKNAVADTWGGIKSAVSAMCEAVKKGNSDVMGTGIKAAVSGYAESKANREAEKAKEESEKSGKEITIANYGVANLDDVNNKISNANKGLSISKAGCFGVLAMAGTGATFEGAAISLEAIGGITIGSLAAPVAIGVAIGIVATLVSDPVIAGQSTDAEMAAIKAQQEEKEKEDDTTRSGNKSTVKTNKGREIDVSPSKNHTTTKKNPGPEGTSDSSVDILDENGNVVTRRWYDSQGKAYIDVDMTNHGNPKTHPEYPHEHTWDWSTGKPIRK